MTKPTDDRESADYRVEHLDDGMLFHLTRDAKRNAITRAILDGLESCLDRLERAGARGFLVIVGEGERAFCSGTDLAELQGMDGAARMDKSLRARGLFVRLSRSPVISVAAINGLAFGGGLELAMATTMRIAVPHASACLPEIKLGLLPAYGGTQFLPALVGQARALDLMLTARVVDAQEALAIGLFGRLAANRASLREEAIELARSVTRFPRTAIDAIRQAVSVAGPVVSDAGLRLEDAMVRSVFDSPGAREGIAAFLEKRAPDFRNS